MVYILFAIITVEINKQNIIEQNMLKYIFRNPEKTILSNLSQQTLKNNKKNMGCSDDPILVKNVDDLGLVCQRLNRKDY